MPLEQDAEGIRISVDMAAEQLLVGWGAVISARPGRQAMVGWLPWLRQGMTARRLLVRFRRFLPPPW
jgi:hypothetical protein